QSGPAVVAKPERRESRPGFGKHVEGCLPAAHNKIGRSRHVSAKPARPPHREIVNTVGHKAVLGKIAVDAVVAVRLEWIVDGSTEARVSRIQGRGFLIEICVS